MKRVIAYPRNSRDWRALYRAPGSLGGIAALPMARRAAARIMITHHDPRAITIAIAIEGRSVDQVPIAKSEAIYICDQKTRQSANFCFHNATKALKPQKIAKSRN